MRCYKVVMRVYNPEIGHVMVSVSAYGKWELVYNEGIVTKPKIGKLFVFKESSNALWFAQSLGRNSLVLGCECGELSQADYASKNQDPESIEKWWTEPDSDDIMPVPNGTYFTDWVMPIAEVKHYEA